MICKRCLKDYLDEYNFCPFCGLVKEQYLIKNNDFQEKPKHQKIEYRNERIDLDLQWKSSQLTFDELDRMHSVIPLELKEKANQLLSKRIKELGQEGWEPKENFMDIDNLKCRPSSKLVYESKAAFFGRKNHIHSIILAFRRVIK